MPHHKRATLLSAAESFCNAFASQKPLDDILAHFSTTHDIMAHEHGLQQLAPFLGRQYTGRQGVKEYFETLASYLSYENMKFNTYVVDAAENRVSVRGEATFTWTRTGQSWDEIFTYVLALDEDGKVVKYEVWADAGAAYLASKGQLDALRQK